MTDRAASELDAAAFLLATRIQREASLRMAVPSAEPADDDPDHVRAAEFLLATRAQQEASQRAVKHAREQQPE